MEQFYASAGDEAVALRRAAARAGCRISTLVTEPARLDVVGGISRMQSTGGDRAVVVGALSCRDGWVAAKLLLALAIEDARTPGCIALARRLRAESGGDDRAFALAVHSFVSRVPFYRERGEVFQSGAATLNRNGGDCDDHFRLAYALAYAGGLRAGLAVLHHGKDAPPNKQGPAHAVAVLDAGDGWRFAETTVRAHFGENPNAAALRLGLTSERTDIAREVVIMSEKDLAPVPAGFRERNSGAQVALDAEALQRLGFLDDRACASAMTDPTFSTLRAAVLSFQIAHGIVADGLLGPTTRLTLARALQTAGIADFDYPGIAGLDGDAPPAAPVVTSATAHISDDFLRDVIAMAQRWKDQGATAEAEDWLQVWAYESGISNIQTRVINPETGLPYSNAGINQMGESERRACGFLGGLRPWLQMGLREQLPYVECFYKSAVATGKTTGAAYRDAGSIYVATFAPAHLGHAGEPDFALYRAPSKQYLANAGLDVGPNPFTPHKGYISVDDMRHALVRIGKSQLFTEVRARVRALGGSPSPGLLALSGSSIVGRGSALLFVMAIGLSTVLAVRA